MNSGMQNLHFLAIFISSMLVAGYVLFKGFKRPTNVAFFLISVSGGLWVLFLFLLSNNTQHDIVLMFSKCAFFFGMLAPAALLHLVFVYPYRQILKKTAVMIYFPTMIVVALIWTNLIIENCEIHPWGVKIIPGKLYTIILVYFLSYLALIIRQIAKGLKNARGLERLKWIYIIFGLPLPIIHILITNLILPRLGFDGVYKLGPWAAVEMMLILGYAIVQYKLFDIEVVIRKTTLYGIMVVVCFSINLALMSALRQITGLNLNAPMVGLIFLITLVFVLIIFPLKSIIESLGEKTLFKKRTDYYNLLNQIADRMKQVISQDELVELVAHELQAGMSLKYIAVYLQKDKKDFYCKCQLPDCGEPSLGPETVSKDNPILGLLARKQECLDIEEIAQTALRVNTPESFSFIRQFRMCNLFPLMHKAELMGFIALGERAGGEYITNRETAIVKTLARELSIHLENSGLYEKLKSSEKLSLLGTIAASLAHEIHNPLTSVKSLVAMLPLKNGNQEFIGKFMEIVPRDIDRVLAITKGLEGFALPTFSEPAILEIKSTMEQALALLQNRITAAQVEIVIDIADHLQIKADNRKLSQLFMNLILNACQASKPGNKIIIQARRDDAQGIGGSLVVDIIDEGEGIKVKELPRIFEPFYSTRIYGTGLGLPACKRIVEEHSGEIRVESQEGKGTRVSILLPMNPK